MLTFKVKIFCVHLQEIYLPMRKSAAREESDHTNKHQGMKCETSEDSWGVEKKRSERRERKHSWQYVCSYAVQLVASQFCWPPLHAPSPHHSPACLDAQQPPPTPPPCCCCCWSSHVTSASHQNDPPPHISALVWAHSWVLDTDLTRAPLVGWLVAWQADGRPACWLKLFCCLTGHHFDGAEVIADRQTKMSCWEILDIRSYFHELVGWFD